MKNITPFQLVLTGVFAAFIIIGVAFFALFRGGTSPIPASNLTVWGTIPEKQFNQLTGLPGVLDTLPIVVSNYREIDPVEFDQEFIEALARGEAPDLVMVPHTSIVRHRDKLFAIPYETYSQRTFINNFIEGAEIFLSDEGVVAVPLLLDPLVMYWNKTILTNAGIATPPEYWDQFFTLTDQLVEKDESFNISQAAIAFGEYENVTNAKEIVSALIMQAGSPITTRTGNQIKSSLADTFNQPIRPADAAVNFYTEFSNPVKTFYSWNRSLPESQQYFASGDLAVYFGFASEATEINQKNPNLNFDVALFPQSRGGAETITFANIVGLAIPKAAPDTAGAYRLITALTSESILQKFIDFSGLPPVRRDVISNRPSDPFFAIFYDSALWSRAWLDPDKEQTEDIFKTMIENITSGREGVSNSVQQASTRLQRLLSDVEF